VSETVLIVDDSLTVRMDLVAAFEEAGFRPLPCATIAEARETIAHEKVAVAVLDVLLPDGDGVEFLSELRATEQGSKLAILMLSTEGDVKHRIRGLKKGADEYVGKPYDAKHVVATARRLLRMTDEPTGGRTTVLIVDDSTTFRETMSEAFQNAGYDVLTAATGEEGLRVVADRRPNVVLVDGFLPGIDGAAVIRRVRLDAALRGIPCLLLTGSDDRDAELRTSRSSSRRQQRYCAARQPLRAARSEASTGRTRFSPSTTARPISTSSPTCFAARATMWCRRIPERRRSTFSRSSRSNASCSTC
jgi:DNA-binding response OmpR family regulator